MDRCSKCGGRLSPQGDGLLKCEECGGVFLSKDDGAETVKSRRVETESKGGHEGQPVFAPSGGGGKKNANGRFSSVIAFFRRYGLKVVLPAVLLIVAFITLMTCFCGLRGIYVNVKNPDFYYSFNATSFSGTSGDEIVSGKWRRSGGTLQLEVSVPYLGDMTIPVKFSKVDGYDRVMIDGEEYRRVSLIRMEDNKSKVKVTFNGNGGVVKEAEKEYKIGIGSKIKFGFLPYAEHGSGEEYIFMGWYTSPDGWKNGESEYDVQSRFWEDVTLYANWNNTTEYEMTCSIFGQDTHVVFHEGDNLTDIFTQAVSGGSPCEITGIRFMHKGVEVADNIAPAGNVVVDVSNAVIIVENNLRCVGGDVSELIIPANVTSISSGAFADGHAGRERIEVEDGNTVYHVDGNCLIETASKTLIAGCKNSVIPDDGSVTEIADYAFKECNRHTLTIPLAVTVIGDDAFEHCDGTVMRCEAAECPSGWENKWNNFGNCPVIWDCNNNDKDEDGYAYTVVGDLQYRLKDGNAEVYRQPYAPSEHVEIADAVDYNGRTYRVTGIGEYAFSEFDKLTSVAIPDGVTEIGQAAFDMCEALVSVNIPDSVAVVGASAFFHTAWYDNMPDGIVYIGKAAYGYKGVLPEGANLTFKDGTLSISDSAFYYGYEVATVTIPDSVKRIGDNAFGDCGNLTSVIIGNGVTEICSDAFSGCESLTVVTIPENVTTIGDGAFSACDNLTLINWNAVSVESQNTVFYSGTGTTDAGLKVAFGDGVRKIPAFAFFESNLTSVDIPDGVTHIGDYAFAYSGLTSVDIPGSVESFGKNIFEYCSKLTSAVISEGMFYGSALTSISVPKSVTEIVGTIVFNDCYGLNSINYNGSKDEWNRIKKDEDWCYHSMIEKVICTDGSVSI